MHIKTYNDGKQKSQSWEATVSEMGPDCPFCFYNLTGYGATEREAKSDLLKKTNEAANEMEAIVSFVHRECQ